MQLFGNKQKRFKPPAASKMKLEKENERILKRIVKNGKLVYNKN